MKPRPPDVFGPIQEFVQTSDYPHHVEKAARVADVDHVPHSILCMATRDYSEMPVMPLDNKNRNGGRPAMILLDVLRGRQ